jgi:hypothetical protein
MLKEVREIILGHIGPIWHFYVEQKSYLVVWLKNQQMH